MAVDVRSTEANKALVRRAVGYNHGATDEGNEIFLLQLIGAIPPA